MSLAAQPKVLPTQSIPMEHAFRKALPRALWRTLRADGFNGSGNTLRRVALPLVHVFNIQGDRHGGGNSGCA